MRAADRVTVSPALTVSGELRVPGDKSISHRYALLAAIADGCSTIANYAPGADCASTLSCVSALGAIVSRTSERRDGEPPLVSIDGRGLRGLRAASEPLDCGNSGSTMRMLGGVVAAHPFISTLIGDASLSRRPMRRIIGPLVANGRRHHRRPRRSTARHDPRRGAFRHPVHAGNTERPGEIRRVAGRPAGERRDLGSGARLYSGSYGTRAGRVRRAGRGRAAGLSA